MHSKMTRQNFVNIHQEFTLNSYTCVLLCFRKVPSQQKPGRSLFKTNICGVWIAQ